MQFTFLCENISIRIQGLRSYQLAACHDLAKQMLYRNYVYHVTDSVTIIDSDEFYYTFQNYHEDYKNLISKLKKMITSNEDNFRVPKKILDLFLSFYAILQPNYEKFWHYNDKKNNVDTDVIALPSFVPRLVLRHYQRHKTLIKPPLIEEFYGCVQFVDISGFTPLAEKLGEEGDKGMEKLTIYLFSKGRCT